ncbi:hypothetical protein O7614_26650 [Micromonospora sp. WMMD961]|uniref:Gp37-like protein n=1 Tax=Micromonospora sp. WMMD961 TaxID=3016100 RepID=UPI002417A3C4|nr:hypothetical protein [Micromonospora sp. WMMD961]MDG4783245.1 hypothetical protein [Micromonospora sp. WMMD961]
MKLADITVEVRDKSLARIGQIRPEDLDLELSDLHNNVGTWKLRLAAEHPLAGVLRQPGSGIIVTGPSDVLFSGPTVKPENQATATDPAGLVTFEGVDDTVLLADALAFPQPSNADPETQTQAHDIRTGNAETLMHAFVSANIGPGAPAARRTSGLLVAKLTMGANLARGPVTTKSARFPVLGNLLSELAATANLGFRIVQRGNVLVFETSAVADRSAEIRLDIRNNTLAGHKVAISPPGSTRAIVAGQNEGVNRQFLQVTTAESLAGESDWGRRIERFVDQRNTDKIEELRQAGLERLADDGASTLAVQVVPMEDSSMDFGVHWNVGDKVGVVVEQQELSTTVTGYILKVDKDGFRLGAVLGDPSGFNPDAALAKRVQNTESRVSALERNAEANTDLEPQVGDLITQVNSLDVRTDILELAQHLPTNAAVEADPPAGKYPLGISVMGTTTGAGWSVGDSYGTVVTNYWADNRCQQWFHHYANTDDTWRRTYHSSTGWRPWKKLAYNEDSYYARTGALTAGQWYRIASFGADTGAGAKAAAEFVISSDQNHTFLRLRASVAFNSPRATISVEECSGYQDTPLFTLARIVGLNGLSGGHALELYCTGLTSAGSVRIDVKHDDWRGGNSQPAAQRWGSIGLAAVPATPTSPQTVLLQRGVWYTGDWTYATYQNGWSQLSGYGPARFRMRPGGEVEIGGVVRGGTINSEGGAPSFTLPVGCRPGFRTVYASLNGSNTIARGDVYPDGRVCVIIGSPGSHSFDGITFLAEN